MKRRDLVTRLSQSAIGATGVAIVGGCQKAQNQELVGFNTDKLPTVKWQMAS